MLGLGGAEIVFMPTATSRMARYLWDLELRAHAVANVYYVCGVNKVGVDVGGSTRDHHGASLIRAEHADGPGVERDGHAHALVHALEQHFGAGRRE